MAGSHINAVHAKDVMDLITVGLVVDLTNVVQGWCTNLAAMGLVAASGGTFQLNSTRTNDNS
ncbi:SDR family oxidoreductase [Sesbania bispinosa]|nr:SDR family oxidoreductase [Sesbania bispinosa]